MHMCSANSIYSASLSPRSSQAPSADDSSRPSSMRRLNWVRKKRKIAFYYYYSYRYILTTPKFVPECSVYMRRETTNWIFYLLVVVFPYFICYPIYNRMYLILSLWFCFPKKIGSRADRGTWIENKIRFSLSSPPLSSRHKKKKAASGEYWEICQQVSRCFQRR